MKTTLKITSIIALALFSNAVSAQNKVETDTTKSKAIPLDDVLVSAVRVTDKTPVTFSNVSKQELAKRNLGQDIPVLLNFLPSVVTTTDAGNGFGYTSIRVRGSDGSRVNVTINGIPYNDAESSGTYFVDMPDFASSLESIQLQRGVGTSTNGAGAFGASLNMLTNSYSKESNGEISNSFGSFGSLKNTIKFSTGLMNDHFEIAGRLSNLHSDGYVDRASSDLKSYFLQGTYVGKTTLIKALAFGGKEKTYQAWYGVDSETLKNDRTFNFAGMYTDVNGNNQFYDNQTDNYNQDNYQLHWNEKLSSYWSTNLAFHYTKGKGYYENYEDNVDFADFGLTPVGAQTKTDVIDRKWLDNNFYGTTFSANYIAGKIDFIFGGAVNKYDGKSFGNILWAQYALTDSYNPRYYDFYGNKIDGNAFAKMNYKLSNKWSLYGDLQYRKINYKADGVLAGKINENFNFFNPKAGITFTLNNKNNLYLSYAKANREPNRTDFENGTPKSESLDDVELGWRHNSKKAKWNANMYYMAYHNQLVLTGELDDVGNPIRSNAGKSYRLGSEVDVTYSIVKKLTIQLNTTLSSNIIRDENSFSGKQIAFSPSNISGAIFTYSPIESFQISWLQKYVSKQYLSNSESEASKLPSYYINDFNISYNLKTKSVFKSILFTGLVNNVFDKKYVSNGADYGGGYIYYYPQAGINFLLGMSLKF